MTTFHNFALKIETYWAETVVKPIFETWNVNDVTVYVWLIYSFKKLFGAFFPPITYKHLPELPKQDQ